jgi:hypothetical protein
MPQGVDLNVIPWFNQIEEHQKINGQLFANSQY